MVPIKKTRNKGHQVNFNNIGIDEADNGSCCGSNYSLDTIEDRVHYHVHKNTEEAEEDRRLFN